MMLIALVASMSRCLGGPSNHGGRQIFIGSMEQVYKAHSRKDRPRSDPAKEALNARLPSTTYPHPFLLFVGLAAVCLGLNTKFLVWVASQDSKTPKETTPLLFSTSPVYWPSWTSDEIALSGRAGSMKHQGGQQVAEQLIDPDALHPDFEQRLSDHEPDLQRLYRDIRRYVLSVSGNCNELLYHSHALTSVYTLSDKLKDAFCHIAIYSKHINLGFNSGALLDDPAGILEGTGTKIRHITLRNRDGLDRAEVTHMLERSVDLAQQQLKSAQIVTGQVFSKIKA